MPQLAVMDELVQGLAGQLARFVAELAEGDRVDEGGAPFEVKTEDALRDGLQQQLVVAAQPGGFREGVGGLPQGVGELLLLLDVEDVQHPGHRVGDQQRADGAKDLYRQAQDGEEVVLVEPGGGGPGGRRHDQPAQHPVEGEGPAGEQAAALHRGEGLRGELGADAPGRIGLQPEGRQHRPRKTVQVARPDAQVVEGVTAGEDARRHAAQQQHVHPPGQQALWPPGGPGCVQHAPPELVEHHVGGEQRERAGDDEGGGLAPHDPPQVHPLQRAVGEGEAGQPQAQPCELEAAAFRGPDDDGDAQNQEGEAVDEEDDIHVVGAWAPERGLDGAC